MRVLESARIAVVVPAFNEARWIAETVAGLPGFVDHVIVVDDASGDATTPLARASGSTRVEVIRHPENRGVGAAIGTRDTRPPPRDPHRRAVKAGDRP